MADEPARAPSAPRGKRSQSQTSTAAAATVMTTPSATPASPARFCEPWLLSTSAAPASTSSAAGKRLELQRPVELPPHARGQPVRARASRNGTTHTASTAPKTPAATSSSRRPRRRQIQTATSGTSTDG